MKHLRYFTILAGLALLLAASVLPAAAAGAANVSPPSATYIDNAVHNIPANSGLWYQFNYAGDNSQIVLTLVNGNNSGLEFNVFTPQQAADWWDATPIGRGTAQQVDCNNGAPMENGTCQSDNLDWSGNFNAGGTYYVQVLNNNSAATSALLTISGSGVSLGSSTMTQMTQPPASQPSTVTATATQGMTNTDPQHALYIDGQMHTLPANGSGWYSFSYAGDNSQIVIRLVNGTSSGLGFNVYTPSQISDWWDATPIGRGTVQSVDCNNGAPMEHGACQATDLDWSGNFNAAGTYYVQVVNNNSTPTTAQLTIQGSGVLVTQ